MTENTNKRRRITVTYKSTNPLFEKWLNEWLKEAKEKGSKMECTYRKALSSLKKCPIAFGSGQECKILKGFGDTLCRQMDQRLREHKSQLSDIQNVQATYKDKTENKGTNIEKHLSIPKPKNTKKKMKKTVQTIEFEKKEVDNIDLQNVEVNGELLNNNISVATLRTDSQLSGEYQANSDGLKVGYEHSKKGKTKKVLSQDNKIPICKETSSESIETKISNSQQSQATSSDEEFYILEPGNFDIILYIDIAETSSESSDPLIKELSKLSGVCQFEIKKLHIGDYIWICRHKISKKELVLPFIFERKRLDDFASSIKDGRYKEQKHRLKRSGIENKYYLIEQYQKHVSLPITSLQQAAINTAVQDGFRIKMTSNLNHTAKLLNKYSTLLTQIFEKKTLLICPKENLGPINLSDDMISLMSFKAFNQTSVKNKPLKVTDLFIKMLIQLKGVSLEKAIAITKAYQTPLLLRRAIVESNVDDFQKCLSELKYENQKVGLSLSKTLVQLFTSKQF